MEQTLYLDNIDLADTTKLNYIQRKWYGKYVFKVVVEIDRSKLILNTEKKNWGYWSPYTRYTNAFQLAGTLQNEILLLISDQDHRMRSEGHRVSVFTNSELDVRSIVKNFKNRIISIDRPLNDKHIEVIDKHRKVVVRKNLFENSFKFKVYLKTDWGRRVDRYANVQEFLVNFDNYGVNTVLKDYFNSEVPVRRLGSTAAVYLNDAEDLMMFQLRFHNDIQRVEEAVLLSDL